MASTISFPSAWGNLTITIDSAHTEFTAGVASTTRLIASAVDGTGLKRGEVHLLYNYANGQLTRLRTGALIGTATSGQQSAALNGASTYAAMVDAAITAAASTIIEGIG